MHWTEKAVLADEHGGDRWITGRQCKGCRSAEIVGRKNMLSLGSSKLRTGRDIAVRKSVQDKTNQMEYKCYFYRYSSFKTG